MNKIDAYLKKKNILDFAIKIQEIRSYFMIYLWMLPWAKDIKILKFQSRLKMDEYTLNMKIGPLN